MILLLAGMAHKRPFLLAQTSTRATAKEGKKETALPARGPHPGDNGTVTHLEIRRAAVSPSAPMNGSARGHHDRESKAGAEERLHPLLHHQATALAVLYALGQCATKTSDRPPRALQPHHRAGALQLPGVSAPASEGGALWLSRGRAARLGPVRSRGMGMMTCLRRVNAAGTGRHAFRHRRGDVCTLTLISRRTPRRGKRPLPEGEVRSRNLSDLKTSKRDCRCAAISDGARGQVTIPTSLSGKTGTARFFPVGQSHGLVRLFNEAHHQLVVVVMLAGTRTFNGPNCSVSPAPSFARSPRSATSPRTRLPRRTTTFPTTYSCRPLVPVQTFVSQLFPLFSIAYQSRTSRAELAR